MRSIIVLLMLPLAACRPGHDSSPAEAAIRAVMMREWNQPEAPLIVEPIVADGDFAIADWTQPALGGRALLQRTGDTWSVVLCAGDALKSPDLLEHAGVPRSNAVALLQTLAKAEASMPADRLARIAAFNGIVRMGAGGHAEPGR
jgi:hypothetical protein